MEIKTLDIQYLKTHIFIRTSSLERSQAKKIFEELSSHLGDRNIDETLPPYEGVLIYPTKGTIITFLDTNKVYYVLQKNSILWK